MFFRTSTLNYKNKKYVYLKAVENYRTGSKVKQRELMNLANLNHLPDGDISLLVNSLNDVLAACKTLSPFTRGSARLAFLCALEKIFHPKKNNINSLYREIFFQEKANKTSNNCDHKAFLLDLNKTVLDLTGPIEYITLEYASLPEDLKLLDLTDIKNLFIIFLVTNQGLPIEFKVVNVHNPIIKDLQKCSDISLHNGETDLSLYYSWFIKRTKQFFENNCTVNEVLEMFTLSYLLYRTIGKPQEEHLLTTQMSGVIRYPEYTIPSNTIANKNFSLNK